MTCGSCGAKIADKAIVCYRCGAPTAIPAAPPSTSRAGSRGSSATLIAALVLAAILVVAAVLLPPGSTERHACGVGAGIVAAFGVVRWRRGNRSK